MHQGPGPAVENSAAMENTRRAASAHPDGVAARERDAAFDCRGNGRVAEHGEPGAHGHGGIKALKPRPSGGRKRENMTLKEEKALLVRFAKAAGAGEMLNIHDLKAAYEKAIVHETSKSTIYNLLARPGWRKLMPRPFHPRRDIGQPLLKFAADHLVHIEDYATNVT